MTTFEQNRSMISHTHTSERLISAKQLDHSVELTWSDKAVSRFHFLWLRDNCSTNLHADTQERVFNQLDVSPTVHPLNMAVKDDALHIHWSEHGHRSIYTGDWLREHGYSGHLTPKEPNTTKSWNNTFINSMKSANYSDLIDDDKALYQWMLSLDRDGLVIVKKMPDTDEALVNVAQRIDYLRQTNFGVTFEVKAEHNPINLAYTALALPLHTDLSNQETPPGYQFLHCLANDSEGGESIFTDGLRVLEDLRQESLTNFNLLAQHAIPFRFHDKHHDIRFHHPVINLDHHGQIVELKYNAHLAGVFDLPEDIMNDYYLAYRDLMQRVQSPQYKIQLKLAPGDLVVFDNRRVLHGRESYEPSGRRHLRGCYVDRTEFKSRLRVLEKQFEPLTA